MADDVQAAIEVEIQISAAAVGRKLANDQSFLELVRTNQLKRGRTQSNIYGRFAQQHTPPQQTRKLY